MRKLGPEEALLGHVVKYARHRGWIVYHQRPARTKYGWRTALMGDKGFPDLVMLRNGRVVIAELKSDRGTTSFQQRVWLGCWREVPGVEVYLWKPKDWTQILEVLN